MKNLKITQFIILILFLGIHFVCFSSFARPSHFIKNQIDFKASMKRAHSLVEKNQVTQAILLLNSLLTQSTDDRKNELNMLKARIEFNRKNYNQALIEYNKISKNSSLWISSVEERAWVKVHLGQMNEAIADSHTLMSPLFNDITSPEAYYLSAYVAHQVCDFTRVFKVIEQFKKISGSKIVSIEKSLTQSKNMKNSLDVKLFKDVIANLHLIEADAIQRIYLDQKLKGNRSLIGQNQKANSYDLQFPYEEDDVWIDEIDQLKVDAKNCPTLNKKVVSL